MEVPEQELDTFEETKPIEAVVSIDPGFLNLGIAVVGKEKHELLFSSIDDLGWVDRAHASRNLGEISMRCFMILSAIKKLLAEKAYVTTVLVERQGQGAPFEQLEGMLVAHASMVFFPANIVTIHPMSVARWCPRKFKNRTDKKNWTKSKVRDHFKKKELGVDECDALLNYMYFSKLKLPLQ